MDVVGYEMSKNCADQVFKEAGFAEGQGRDQVGVVELHDCFAANEVCITFTQPQSFIYLCRALWTAHYLPSFGTLCSRRGTQARRAWR